MPGDRFVANAATLPKPIKPKMPISSEDIVKIIRAARDHEMRLKGQRFPKTTPPLADPHDKNSAPSAHMPHLKTPCLARLLLVF